MGSKRDKIVGLYLQLVKTKGKHPSYLDLAEVNITPAQVRHNFGSLGKLQKRLAEANPKFFAKFVKVKSKQELVDEAINKAFRSFR